MVKGLVRTATLAVACLSFYCACTGEPQYGHGEGTRILFGASTSWLDDQGTRTEFSGVDEEGRPMRAESVYERIDWEPGYDRIRILCEAAGNGPSADYLLTGTAVTSGQKSLASVSPVSGNGLQWGSSTEDHYFYAFYPAPGMKSSQDVEVSEEDATIVAESGNAAKVTGVIPATQSVVRDGNVYKPDMTRAYMYAATKIPSGSSGTVSLSFHPLVTTFEFTLLNLAGDPVNSNLTAVKLRSSSTALTGRFTASLSDESDPEITVSESAGNTITVDLPDGGTRLDDTNPVKVTLLALPVRQTGLTLELLFENGARRTLELKEDNNTKWVEVQACKKLYVHNMGVPGNIYYFDVVGPESSLSGEQSNGTYTVKSYRNASGENLAVGWTASFSEDGGTTWSDTAPSWVTSFTSADIGSVDAKAYEIAVSKNDDSTPRSWSGGTSPSGNGTMETAVDLALVDIYGNPTGKRLTTANCYVVSGPGWYKFPCVYGNALNNGTSDPATYTSQSTNPNTLSSFVRHDDQPIVQAWIQNNISAVKDDSRTAVKLLWQDKQNLISTSPSQLFSQKEDDYPNGSVGGRFIYFYVDPASIGQGNAVIALYADDVIVWSWHIWVIEKERLTTTKMYVKHEDHSSVVDPVEFLTTNLGWTDASLVTTPRSVLVRITQAVTGRTAEFSLDQQQLHGKGGNVYYQWGRKDPMLGFNELFVEKTQYSDAAPWRIETTNLSAEQMSLGYVIQTPNVYYAASNWERTGPYNNLWNNHVNTAYDTDVEVVKTVYDPCPVGFKVPNRNAFATLVKRGSENYSSPISSATWDADIIGTWNQGYLIRRYEGDLEGLFFPATFLRSSADGTIDSWRINGGIGPFGTYEDPYIGGYYWTASTRHHQERWGGSYLEFRNTSPRVTPANDWGPVSFGFSILPVTE